MQAAKGAFKTAEMTVIVTRADGTIEDYGVVSRYHKNKLIHWLWSVQDRARVRRLKSKYRA